MAELMTRVPPSPWWTYTSWWLHQKPEIERFHVLTYALWAGALGRYTPRGTVPAVLLTVTALMIAAGMRRERNHPTRPTEKRD